MKLTPLRIICISVALLLVAAGWSQVSTTTPLGQVSTAPSSDYQLGPGDSFEADLSNHPELSGIYLIPDDGYVVFPEVGSVKVQGLTLANLNLLLGKKYNQILFDPHVTVFFKVRRATQIPVLGDLVKPAVLPLIPGVHVADAISNAGGLLPDIRASEVTVTVSHRDGTKTSFPMADMLAGTVGDNPVLQEGDSVFVDTGEFVVYVSGQVTKPGSTPLKRGAGVAEAVAAAGGATETGAISRVQITHLDGSVETVNLVPALIDGNTTKLPRLRTGDLVTVPLTTLQFAILGHVNNPGVFPIPEGQTMTLAKAMGLAKGDIRGRLSKVSVARILNGKPTQMVYNFAKYLRTADPTQNPVIVPGDVVFVPQTNSVDAGTILGAIGAGALIYNASRN